MIFLWPNDAMMIRRRSRRAIIMKLFFECESESCTAFFVPSCSQIILVRFSIFLRRVAFCQVFRVYNRIKISSPYNFVEAD